MKKMLFVENRNHVMRDLPRFVDIECKKWPVVELKHFSERSCCLNLDSACDKKLHVVPWVWGTMCA